MAEAPKILVSVVSYRCAEETTECVTSLQGSMLKPVQVHICENGGGEAYAEILALFEQTFGTSAPAETKGKQARLWKALDPGFDLILHDAGANLGYAGGVNLCVHSADTEWTRLFVLNPDCRVLPETLSALENYTTTGSYGMVGCRILFRESGRVQMYGGGEWRSWMGRARNIGFMSQGDAKPDIAAVERELDYICGAALYATRDCIGAIGLMREDYFLYMEEVDWCFRHGDFKLGYCHESVVLHGHGVTTGASVDPGQRSPLSIYLNERNKLAFTRRFFPGRYPVTALLTLALTGLYIRRSGWASFKVALSGWWAGIRHETGRPDW